MNVQRILMRSCLMVLFTMCMAIASNAQDSRLVGMWQMVVNVDKATVTLGPAGKVFLADGRLFGFYLNPADLQNYSQYNFSPWLFGKFTISSDSTYTEHIFLHEDPAFEGSLDFKFMVMNNHALVTQYVRKAPDGSMQPVTELWIKMAKGKDEEEKVLKRVKENWDNYVERAKMVFGRN